MTPQEFIRKWKPVALTERATAQEHFLDLCRLFDHPTPAEDDPTGERFTFEKGVSRTGGGDGFADVWKKGFFAWEYKKKKRDLDKALEQLTRYAAALENPPLHVACDTHLFRIETRWTNEVPAKYQFDIEDLDDPRNLAILHNVFHDPEKLRSGRTRAVLTKQAAEKFQSISDSLQHRNPDGEAVAHFVNQLVFCFFADSVGLLPAAVWRKLLQAASRRPDKSQEWLARLFGDMNTGGDFDLENIAEFNGGLFDGRPPLKLEHTEIGLLFAAASLDWSLIDPTIFGTLFERFLDPDKRAQIGAHYTDPDKIMMIVEPVIARPLRLEWEAAKAEIAGIMAPVLSENGTGGRTAARDRNKRFEAARIKAEIRRDAFIDRLCALRILDPACGSGNFLYLALQTVKDIEYQAILDCAALELNYVVPRVGPEILHGIEINPFAAELARTTIWIGDIQWRVRNAIAHHPRPILRKLDAIECRDALLTADGREAEWPEADYIVGNPPFLGGKLLRRGLGDATVEALFRVYAGKVPAEADLVCYWFYEAWKAIGDGRAKRVGFVATNSIRNGASRAVLEPIANSNSLFECWSDQPWTLEGAAVRVSIACFVSDGGSEAKLLDGTVVQEIAADLSGSGTDLTRSERLAENSAVSFQGITKGGPFEIPARTARIWLEEPLNPNGRPNSDVLHPIVSGGDIVRAKEPGWVPDFTKYSESEAALFAAPFSHVELHVKTFRASNNRLLYRNFWWKFAEGRPSLLAQIAALHRYIAAPKVSQHRLFVWLDSIVYPDNLVIAITRDDDVTFGILSSRLHVEWSLKLGSTLEDRPTYTPSSTFETFPFPAGLTPNLPAVDYADDPRAQRIAQAAKKLDELRRYWLNPPDLVDIVPEIIPTAAPDEAPRRYPYRILPKTVEAAAKLRSRTLTNLYNERPRWLADAHETLDRAVAAAYGWPEDIATDEALARLLALNLERAAKQGAVPTAVESAEDEAEEG